MPSVVCSEFFAGPQQADHLCQGRDHVRWPCKGVQHQPSRERPQLLDSLQHLPICPHAVHLQSEVRPWKTISRQPAWQMRPTCAKCTWFVGFLLLVLCNECCTSATDMGRASSLPSCSCCRNACSWVAMSAPWCALSSPHCAAHARAIVEKWRMYRLWSELDRMRIIVMRFSSADLTKPRAGDRFQRFPQPLQPVLRALGHIPALTRSSYRESIAPDATHACTHSWHAVQDSPSWYLGCRLQLTAHQGCSPKLGVTSAYFFASSRTCKSPAEGSQACVSGSVKLACQIAVCNPQSHEHLLLVGGINTCTSAVRSPATEVSPCTSRPRMCHSH
jgi:hypothetical protein